MRHAVLVPAMIYTSLVYERRAAVAVVTLNDPPHNRTSFAFMNELESLVDEIAADSGVRSVVITAAGDQNFSVGMNLKELVPVLGDRGRVDEILDQRLRVLSAIENIGKPWVATLFGNCLGGGLPRSTAPTSGCLFSQRSAYTSVRQRNRLV